MNNPLRSKLQSATLQQREIEWECTGPEVDQTSIDEAVREGIEFLKDNPGTKSFVWSEGTVMIVVERSMSSMGGFIAYDCPIAARAYIPSP